jgi:hypothetical protein
MRSHGSSHNKVRFRQRLMLRGVSVPAQYGQGLLDDSGKLFQKQTPVHLTG